VFLCREQKQITFECLIRSETLEIDVLFNKIYFKVWCEFLNFECVTPDILKLPQYIHMYIDT